MSCLILEVHAGKKGKNQATIEDIKEITSLVKGVEIKVNILTNNRIDYSSLKRQYIIDYFASYNRDRTITSANLKDLEISRKKIKRI
ncbi:hypothetical protein [Aestuariibaculum suncheonense]|uniref:Uncharacterized protein n=1 Tax=Aestuariibaculum suncheonense TaxID=1028745 RepID=A0A8J6UBP2_9FLAO|nr:hypothetical protein [Aestuariibaculum suncheonense]MBD0836070.1 hypothetical protein [Aestuariibaculum suncheonense]